MKLRTPEQLLIAGKQSGGRTLSEYVTEPHMAVYLRAGPYHLQDGKRVLAVGIANVSVEGDKHRSGLFKGFLSRLMFYARAHYYKVVRVEQVGNEHLEAYLRKIGFSTLQSTDVTGPPTLFKYLD